MHRAGNGTRASAVAGRDTDHYANQTFIYLTNRVVLKSNNNQTKGGKKKKKKELIKIQPISKRVGGAKCAMGNVKETNHFLTDESFDLRHQIGPRNLMDFHRNKSINLIEYDLILILFPPHIS